MDSIKVIIIDGNKPYCSRVARILSTAGVEVLSTSNNTHDFEKIMSNAVLADILLVSRSILSDSRLCWIRNEFPQLKIIVLMVQADQEKIKTERARKVEGVLIKFNGEPQEILEILKTIYNGNFHFPQGK
jgi:DNA-binding NarL/FixJ family response regulator